MQVPSTEGEAAYRTGYFGDSGLTQVLAQVRGQILHFFLVYRRRIRHEF